MMKPDITKLSRRELIKLGLMSGAATIVGSGTIGKEAFASCSLPANTGCGPNEVFPTTPFILNPFTDPLPIPQAAKPVDPTTLRNRAGFLAPPGPGGGQQCSDGTQTHQIWPTSINYRGGPLPDPIVYHFRLGVGQHSFTNSLVQPIDKGGLPVIPPTGIAGPQTLPASTIYGFNSQFPGPMINAEYGKPVIVRFENDLDINPLNLDRQDFGAPDLAFLTHLHNGHTAPESDGNPHQRPCAYDPGMWVDNMYLNWPAGGDDSEIQSFFWFHDHRMDHTGANVYKGMVGLYPIYDPILDPGDETKKGGLGLPGVKVNNGDGTFDVKYDIPLVFYDCCLDDGITPHADFHNGCGELHPEWWGKTYFRHFPNHGFVGDLFTVNGAAFPVLNVDRRKYRLRFLDASISRCYELMLMSSTGGPVAAPGTQGQYQLPDGQQCMRFTQISSEGGLLPKPLVRDSFQIWPAKRREFVVDFTKYQDGSPTKPGDVIYLTNVLEMPDGRKPNFNAPGATLFYKVPMMKIVIGGLPAQPDVSKVPNQLRPMPVLPKNKASLPTRTFVLQRGGGTGEVQWLINGLPFDPNVSLANPKKGSAEIWTIQNGGGGWVHPMHLHMEEHTVLSRTGSTNTHPDDTGKEDVIALDPSETVVIFRQFRTFVGPYVAHCHNLAHEDHAMMFGWSIAP